MLCPELSSSGFIVAPPQGNVSTRPITACPASWVAVARIRRLCMVDGGQMIEVTFVVDDPDAFYQPWSGMRRYRRAQRETIEDICAENNQHLFDYHLPVASKPDF
jgi:hypothetical protein